MVIELISREPPPSPASAAGEPGGDALLQALLARLYREEIAADAGTGYLALHATPEAIANRVRTFRWYEPHLREARRVLDWGCRHAPDSCLLRACGGEGLEIHGCDFDPPGRYGSFHGNAALAYRRLEETVVLPYADSSFDAVIAAGVLEHVAMDYESLKEVHRVLRPDGVLAISYLPNRLSVREWILRHVRREGFHLRLYGLREARALLLRSGFVPVSGGYHTFFWDRCLGAIPARLRRPLAAALPRLLPLHASCSTLCFVARRATSL